MWYTWKACQNYAEDGKNNQSQILDSVFLCEGDAKRVILLCIKCDLFNLFALSLFISQIYFGILHSKCVCQRKHQTFGCFQQTNKTKTIAVVIVVSRGIYTKPFLHNIRTFNELFLGFDVYGTWNLSCDLILLKKTVCSKTTTTKRHVKMMRFK